MFSSCSFSLLFQTLHCNPTASNSCFLAVRSRPLHPCALACSSIFHQFPSSVFPKGVPVVPRLPEIQAGGRLRPLLPRIHRPQPGCGRSTLHVLWRERLGEPGRRRRPGQQRRGLRRLRRLPAPRLLRRRGSDGALGLRCCPNKTKKNSNLNEYFCCFLSLKTTASDRPWLRVSNNRSSRNSDGLF